MAKGLEGRNFGKLLVIRRQPVAGTRNKMYLCGCECGNEIVAPEKYLLRNAIRSCGCGNNRQKNLAGFTFGGVKVIVPAKPIDGQEAVRCQCEACGAVHSVKRSFLTLGAAAICPCHGKKAPHPYEHQVWRGMIARCESHEYYFGRGIVVCDGWRTSFDAFLKSVGSRPMHELSIDRIDNDGNYSCGECEQCKANGWPMNCRWATAREQILNRRTTLKAMWKGEMLPISTIAERQSVDRLALTRLIQRGKAAEQAVEMLKET